MKKKITSRRRVGHVLEKSRFDFGGLCEFEKKKGGPYARTGRAMFLVIACPRMPWSLENTDSAKLREKAWIECFPE